MKNTTKLINILTAFLGVIGLCAAALVCFIVIYTQITGGFSKKDTADSNIAVAQADDTASENITSHITQSDNSTSDSSSDTDTVNNDISNVDMINTDQETEILPTSTGQTSDINGDVPAEYASALSKAANYSDMMYMSKAAIYDQLTSEYGERFSPDAAQYAIDNMTADWNSNALQKAKNYSDTLYMSKAAIYDQLISDYGERFTPSEAQYAVDNLDADWNYNALQKAKNYQNTMNMSPDAIHDQLTSEYGEKFTSAEADYAVSNIGN